MRTIHPTAIVSPKAELGQNVTVGPYATIGDEVVIHDDVEIVSHVVIEGPTEIGAGCKIFPFTSIGVAPQDLKYRGERSYLKIGERNTIREHVTMHRGTEGGGGVTRVGHDNVFMVGTHVAHDCQIGNHVIMANVASLGGHVTIEDHATLGAHVGVHQFCRIGRYAFVGAYAVLVKDALPYATTWGNHATCYGPNVVGLRRKGFASEQIHVIHQAFRLLLQSKLNTSQAVEAIRAQLGGRPEIDYLIEFIETSERGVAK
ncbi:MAG: acyl-ACP--UDP-N-acetylglucosamine O-acyltransferase [Acidobacteria bacterium]|nr:acyl-ACP--UDP-N-acetylglucosamine O-acyltransferase [Acidobacteriota bacterium]